ncbi:MAG TPA: GNAT family N-acetyltransferase [Thermoplasmata archaeon]|nr:GNAT family N-acetyltransferase [Thermoplasmata archaeon]
MTLTIASDPADLATVRELFREYADALPVDLAYQGFDTEVRDLPGPYSAPGGTLILARAGREPVGCAGLRPGPPGSGELKRLYVRAPHRRSGVGRILVETVIEAARGRGYSTLYLDTLPSMEVARRLYLSLGFEETEPYYPSPVPDTRFFRLSL